MHYSREVEEMVCVKKGPDHGPAPIPEEGKWVQAKEIADIATYLASDEAAFTTGQMYMVDGGMTI